MKAVRLYRLRRQTAEEQIMQSLYELTEENLNDSRLRAFSEREIQQRRPLSSISFSQATTRLKKLGWIIHAGENYQLTNAGIERGHDVTLNNRYLQLYSMYELHFAYLPMEKRDWNFLALPKEDLDKFDQLLRDHKLQPILKSHVLGVHAT